MPERLAPSPRSPSMPFDPIVDMPAHTLAEAIRRKDVSCVETMRAYLAHIERVNADVNAIVALREPDALLAEAAQRTRRLRAASTRAGCTACRRRRRTWR